MNAVAQTFALFAGLIHIGIFLLESVLFNRPKVAKAFSGGGQVSPQLRTFAFNQGFYNLFLAAGAIGGVIADNRAIALFSCACMLGAGVVLLASQARLWRGALAQILPAGGALLAALF